MADRLTPERRSNLMRRVRGKNTAPEMVVRRIAHAIGYRYRLHVATLPGKPDLVFPGRRRAIFVHGCFWHGHGCKLGRLPKSRLEFWEPKIVRNRQRDAENVVSLAALGWKTLTIWQCDTRNAEEVRRLLLEFLGSPGGGRIGKPVEPPKQRSVRG